MRTYRTTNTSQTIFNRPKLRPSSDDPLRGRQPTERNRSPDRQCRRPVRRNRCRSRYRSTCCDGRGCGGGSGGSRGNREPGSDGSTWCRSRCRKPERNRTTVQRRTTAQQHRSGRRRSERHKPEQRHRSAQQPHRSLRSTSERRSNRCGPTCDQAEQPLPRSSSRQTSRRPQPKRERTSWGGLQFL
jgi:hypothetical protein